MALAVSPHHPVREPYGILCLDLSSKTGWCYGVGRRRSDNVVAQPAFGVWRLPAPTIAGRRTVAFENELLDAIDAYQPKLVVYEAVLPGHQQAGAAAAELLIGLGQTTDAACYRHEVEVRKEWSSTVRSKVMGPGNGRITSKEKEAGVIVRWLQERGYEVEDHNAADAILLWLFACQVRAHA